MVKKEKLEVGSSHAKVITVIERLNNYHDSLTAIFFEIARDNPQVVVDAYNRVCDKEE